MSGCANALPAKCIERAIITARKWLCRMKTHSLHYSNTPVERSMGIQVFTQVATQRARLLAARNRLLKKCAKLEATLAAHRGEIAELEAQVTAFNIVLAQQGVDIDPDSYTAAAPTPRPYTYFTHGQQTALALDALRTAKRPLSTPAIVEYMVAAADVRWKAPNHRAMVRAGLKRMLGALAARGTVVRVHLPGERPGDVAFWAVPQYAHVPPER